MRFGSALKRELRLTRVSLFKSRQQLFFEIVRNLFVGSWPRGLLCALK